MKSKKAVIIILSLALLMLIGGIGLSQSLAEPTDSASTWHEVTHSGGLITVQSLKQEFDLKKQIKKADYIFSGTVIKSTEYDVEWTDENGEEWGPFPSTVLEVKITKEFYGKSPINSDVIKVYYPYGMTFSFEDSFLLKDNGEYIFVTQSFDEEFLAERAKNAPDDKFGQEKYADVFISDNYYSLMAIEDGKVLLYKGYVSGYADIMKQTISMEKVSSDSLISADNKLSNYVALDITAFDKAFNTILTNPKQSEKVQQITDPIDPPMPTPFPENTRIPNEIDKDTTIIEGSDEEPAPDKDELKIQKEANENEEV